MGHRDQRVAQPEQLTVVLAGGRELGVRTGQSLAYPFHGDEGDKADAARDPRNVSYADLWVAVQNAFGLPDRAFGDAADCRGGLEGLLG